MIRVLLSSCGLIFTTLMWGMLVKQTTCIFTHLGQSSVAALELEDVGLWHWSLDSDLFFLFCICWQQLEYIPCVQVIFRAIFAALTTEQFTGLPGVVWYALYVKYARRGKWLEFYKFFHLTHFKQNKACKAIWGKSTPTTTTHLYCQTFNSIYYYYDYFYLNNISQAHIFLTGHYLVFIWVSSSVWRWEWPEGETIWQLN